MVDLFVGSFIAAICSFHQQSWSPSSSQWGSEIPEFRAYPRTRGHSKSHWFIVTFETCHFGGNPNFQTPTSDSIVGRNRKSYPHFSLRECQSWVSSHLPTPWNPITNGFLQPLQPPVVQGSKRGSDAKLFSLQAFWQFFRVQSNLG